MHAFIFVFVLAFPFDLVVSYFIIIIKDVSHPIYVRVSYMNVVSLFRYIMSYVSYYNELF